MASGRSNIDADIHIALLGNAKTCDDGPKLFSKAG